MKTNARPMCRVMVLLGMAGFSLGATAPLSAQKPKPLPPEIVAAWKEAGAEVGWMRESTFDLPQKGGPQFLPEKEGAAGDLPAFRCDQLKKGLLAKLPPPQTALQTLNLGGTQVTNAGMKEVARLKDLRSLNISNTQVTDKGLKHLAGLKKLEEPYRQCN